MTHSPRTDSMSWPRFEQDELDAVDAVLRSGRVNYWTGEECRSFESEFAAYCGAAYGVAVNSGTSALQLALQLPFLVKHGVRFWRHSGLWHPRMKTIGLLMLPTIFGAAFVGAGLGFLWYNAYPAPIFMGDTGALALGGAIGTLAILICPVYLCFATTH